LDGEDSPGKFGDGSDDGGLAVTEADIQVGDWLYVELFGNWGTAPVI